MFSWYEYALLALLLLGAQRFLYKVAAEKKYQTTWITFSFMATVTFLSAGVYFFQQKPVDAPWILFGVSLVNSGAFLLATVAHIEALKYLPTHTVYTIIRLNVVVIVILSILIFQDKLGGIQVVGILFAVGAMMILTREVQRENVVSSKSRKGFVLALIALVAGAAASISSKFAALYTDKMAFMALSYLISMFGALGLKHWFQKEDVGGGFIKSLPIGVAMGILNFAGFYAFLTALTTGPLSIIAAITGMHFVIAILLSMLIYKEKISRIGFAGVCLTIVSILLLKL
jgi:drug/metabolite transporter (DMT)-like permease